MRHRRPGRRAGFTMVEMLVATALIMFIMIIIAQALGQGTRTFSTLRSAAHLSDEGRTGINVIRKDLWSDHFGGPFGPTGGPHLIDQRLDLAGWHPPFRGYFEIVQIEPSRYETGAAIKPYGVPFLASPPYGDAEKILSSKANNHTLRFTVHLPDAPASELFCAPFHPIFTARADANAFPSTPGILYSRWAQVAYFVTATGEFTGGTNPQPLGALRRRVMLMPPQDIDVSLPTQLAGQLIIDCLRFQNVIQPFPLSPDPNVPGNTIVRLPGPETVNQRDRNAAYPPPYPLLPPLPPPSFQFPPGLPPTWYPMWRVRLSPMVDQNDVQTGEDIVLTNVISFEVRPAWIHNPTWNAPNQNFYPSPFPEDMPNHGNTDEPFSDLPRGSSLNPAFNNPPVGIFDTWYTHPTVDVDWNTPDRNNGFLASSIVMPPHRINVRALQVKIRLWDPKTEQARQVTVINDV
jgi:hypothetical protein